MEKIGNESQLDPWNKTFFTIMAWYPSWKPDRLVSAAWKDELGSFDPEKILETVRLLGINTPSPYPPQVFQILKILMGQQPKKLIANEEWERVIRIAAKGAPSGLVKKLSDETRRVVRALGGFPSLSRLNEKDEPFVKNKFIDLFLEIVPPQYSGTGFAPLASLDVKILRAGDQ